MRLIDEIEAAAMESNDRPDASPMNSPLWPRIHAAIEAGEQMLELLERNEIEHWCMENFRAATEGTDAAAIWRGEGK